MNTRTKNPGWVVRALMIYSIVLLGHLASAQLEIAWIPVDDWTGQGDVSPRERWDTPTFTDSDGRLWIFGGFGPDVSNANTYLNDMWMFEPTSGTWTRIEGGDMGSQFGVYGNLGTPTTETLPGGRDGHCGWTDEEGNLWIYGGFGLADPAEANPTGILSDLWRYNPAAREWTWMQGPKQGNQPPVFGAQGTSGPGFTPGGNNDMPSCIDPTGRFWMFSGIRLRPNPGASRSHHELWSYDPDDGEWTWRRGSMSDNQAAVFVARGVFDATAIPGGRNNGALWADAEGNIWAFGGNGFDRNYANGFLNDMWKFDPALGQWAWIQGSPNVDPRGTHGTLGEPDPANNPGGRRTASYWKGVDGCFYLFGGEGYDGFGNLGRLNDLWRFNPLTEEWTWLHGSKSNGDPGMVTLADDFSTLNLPSARAEGMVWVDAMGDFWLFGGIVIAGGGSTMNVADLWHGRLQFLSRANHWMMFE